MPAPDSPVPYWPAYLPDAAPGTAPCDYQLTPAGEAALDEPEAG